MIGFAQRGSVEELYYGSLLNSVILLLLEKSSTDLIDRAKLDTLARIRFHSMSTSYTNYTRGLQAHFRGIMIRAKFMHRWVRVPGWLMAALRDTRDETHFRGISSDPGLGWY